MNQNKNTNKKVFVGLSGGVDSSVAALLLKKGGFDVVGVFIKAWHPDFLPCNWKYEMRDAMRICAKLQIPFLLCDLEKTYKREVIDYLINEYAMGRTPNPDVLCNKEIKFGAFLNWAVDLGANYVATGHYAQIKDGKMINSIDKDKDQTYFLWTIPENLMNKIMFPIGHLNKSSVRKIALKNNLHTASKKDSQGLCFIGHIDMKNFLRRFINTKKGNVLNEKGDIIGSHDGSELYTIGERHGFSINKKQDNTKTHYITSKNLEKNTITTTDKFEEKDFISSLILENVNVNDSDFIKKIKYTGLELTIKTRYRGELYPAILKRREQDYIINMRNPIKNVASGQSVVFYLNNQCLGGGIVKVTK